jgi:hypothetical protein
VWWVLLALEAARDLASTPAQARSVVLESHRNGFGDERTNALFLATWPLVEHHAESPTGTFWRDWFAAMHRRLAAAACDSTEPSAPLCIGWDEIQDLMTDPASGNDRLFGALFGGRDGVSSFDTVRRLSRTLVESALPWRVAMAGTWQSAESVPVDPTSSPSRISIRSFSFATFVTEDDMLRVLSHFFILDAPAQARLRPHLATLAGRPDFFFRCFFEQLDSALALHSGAATVSMVDVLEGALRATAVERTKHWAKKFRHVVNSLRSMRNTLKLTCRKATKR